MSWSSASVGFWPKDRITVPNSFVVMVPSPSLSNKEKASLNSAICSSVSWSAMAQEAWNHETCEWTGTPWTRIGRGQGLRFLSVVCVVPCLRSFRKHQLYFYILLPGDFLRDLAPLLFQFTKGPASPPISPSLLTSSWGLFIQKKIWSKSAAKNPERQLERDFRHRYLPLWSWRARRSSVQLEQNKYVLGATWPIFFTAGMKIILHAKSTTGTTTITPRTFTQCTASMLQLRCKCVLQWKHNMRESYRKSLPKTSKYQAQKTLAAVTHLAQASIWARTAFAECSNQIPNLSSSSCKAGQHEIWGWIKWGPSPQKWTRNITQQGNSHAIHWTKGNADKSDHRKPIHWNMIMKLGCKLEGWTRRWWFLHGPIQSYAIFKRDIGTNICWLDSGGPVDWQRQSFLRKSSAFMNRTATTTTQSIDRTSTSSFWFQCSFQHVRL